MRSQQRFGCYDVTVVLCERGRALRRRMHLPETAAPTRYRPADTPSVHPVGS